jgi:hypothetical protein
MFRPADICLAVVFVVYVIANVVLVSHAFPPWGAFVAFVIPLPVLFIALAFAAHFLSSPPLFNRWLLLSVVVLVIVEAVINFFVAAEASASV